MELMSPASRRIAQRLAHFTSEKASLVGPEEHVSLLSLYREPSGKVCYEVIYHEAQVSVRPYKSAEILIFEQDLLHLLVNGHSESRLTALDLPTYARPPFSQPQHLIQAIPLAILSAPIAFIIVPDTQINSVIVNELTEKVLLDCMFDELDDMFSPERLATFSRPDILLSNFVESLLPWLAPKQYGARELSKTVGYFDIWGETKVELTTLLTEEIWWHTPVHEKNFSQILSLIEFYFHRTIMPRWHNVRPMDRSILIASLDQAMTYLKQAQEALHEAPPQPTVPAPAVQPYSFFKASGNRNWTIYFNGEEVHIPENKNPAQGLESIRILLQYPDEYIPPLALRQMNRIGYSKSSDALIDRDKDQLNKNELLRMLKNLNSKATKSPVDKMSNREQKKYWLYREAVYKILLLHLPWDRKHRADYKKTQDKLKPLLLVEDDKFKLEVAQETEKLRPSGNVHGITDSLQKGIESALKAMEHPGLVRYLRATLVVKNRDNYTPFLYKPELIQKFDKSFSANALPWDTGEPVYLKMENIEQSDENLVEGEEGEEEE